jgi:hypothetical protein
LRIFFPPSTAEIYYTYICYDVLYQGNNIYTPAMEGMTLPGIKGKILSNLLIAKATR